jgi:hypothetical protein
LLLPVSAHEDENSVPNILGKTLPQAEALLIVSNYQLDPIILSTDSAQGTVNTVVDFEILDDSHVRVTILREYNVELIWENAAAFATQGGLLNLDGDELFSFVNLSNEEFSLRNIQIGSFSTSEWGPTLRPRWCAQIWTFAEDDGLRLPECADVQGGSIVNISNAIQQFWRGNDSFDIYQNGIYRASCQTSAGRCQLWLSPLAIAEDIAPYVYLIYDDTQLIIYNNSASQWMDLSQLAINEMPVLSAPQNWDSGGENDLERLAPHQCVRFTRNQEAEPLLACDVIATQDTRRAEVFWRNVFALVDTLNGHRTYTCPAASNERTICSLGR